MVRRGRERILARFELERSEATATAPLLLWSFRLLPNTWLMSFLFLRLIKLTLHKISWERVQYDHGCTHSAKVTGLLTASIFSSLGRQQVMHFSLWRDKPEYLTFLVPRVREHKAYIPPSLLFPSRDSVSVCLGARGTRFPPSECHQGAIRTKAFLHSPANEVESRWSTEDATHPRRPHWRRE